MLMILIVGALLCSFTCIKPLEAIGVNGGIPCDVCTVTVGILEQYIEIHNASAIEAVDILCKIIPQEFRTMCYDAMKILGPPLIDLLIHKETADVICYSVKICHVDVGQQQCHLFPLPNNFTDNYIVSTQKWLMAKHPILQKYISEIDFSPCQLPGISQLCKWLKRIFDDHDPAYDLDGDLFSVWKTYRGSTWRGKDCNDLKKDIYPGRRPLDHDVEMDSNCNGIHGVEPDTGEAYEEKFCNATSYGFVTLGDSISAHFHLPYQWFSAADLTEEILTNLTFVLSNELDWPHMSFATGYSTVSWPIAQATTDSLYLRLRERNRCNHRDFQNLGVNGATSISFIDLNQTLRRNKTTDKPLLVLYAIQANDVCNSYPDTLKHVTPPEVFRQNVLRTLNQLEILLPLGSHVLLLELVDGSVLYDALAKRLHPLGYLHKDVTYKDLYAWLNCMETIPCVGWQTPNATLRQLLTEKAMLLSAQLKDIAQKYKFKSFNMFYIENPIKKVIQEWLQKGRELWQLIEPVDGFHPNVIAGSLSAGVLWQDILKCCPEVVGEINPYNDDIAKIFGDQGGY